VPVKTATFVSLTVNELGEAPLVVVAVTRQRRADLIEIGCFLVDTGCLGVKDAWLEVLDASEKDAFLAGFFDGDYLEKSGAWGRKFVEDAMEYARSLGFKPHPDYKKAARVFGGIQSSDCDQSFAFGLGKEGKPIYYQSPADSAEKANRIVNHLRQRCGQDGFDFVLAVDDLEDVLDEFLEMAEQGNTVRAAAGIMDIVKAHPELALAQYAAGVVSAFQEDPEKAIEHFETALRLDPEMGIAWYNKGIAHKQLLQFTPMLVALRKAVALGKQGDAYLDQANEIIDLMARSTREDFGIDLDTYIEAGILFDKAWESIDYQDWESGLSGMRQVIQLNPRSHQAHNNMGICLLKLNREEEAREAFRKALEIQPDYGPAKKNLANFEKS
jgi:tetratricopeptide (TPR) repeat protein